MRPDSVWASAPKPFTSVSLLALAAFCALPAQAQSIKTQDKADPRRANSAKILQEQNPQDKDGGKDDEKQVDDSYQPKGIELGSFLLLPQIEVSEGYNSNIYARATDRKSDFTTRITPEFQLRSRFANHMLNISARAEQSLFATYTDDNHLDASTNIVGRYDFSREWEANGSFDAYQAYEDRGSPDAVNGKSPTPTYGFGGRTGTKFQVGRYTFSSEINGARRMFGNVDTSAGTTINNSDRDRNEFGAMGRGSYELFPGYAAVAQVEVNRRQYDSSRDRAGYNRSSSGWRAETGIGVDITQLVRGDFLIGYLKQDYEDSRFKDPSGLAVKSVLNWTPNRMTVVALSLERSVQETTTVNASGMVHSGASVLIRHEMQRNIILTGTASAFQDEFKGANQTNWTYDARARAVYALQPELYVGGELGFRRRTSDKTDVGFSQGVALLRIGARM
ncbi:outer membrane beta-barrel protein [Azospirillum sp. B506]|uniref:outer membrane beta-barrel protein n=1 Tax=Azospirillum sp. B506 TaxID=137721 RepID=UPI00131EFF21|nr:outer membrane beta-barrel protein [Azospirillum sp. B506]